MVIPNTKSHDYKREHIVILDKSPEPNCKQ